MEYGNDDRGNYVIYQDLPIDEQHQNLLEVLSASSKY